MKRLITLLLLVHATASAQSSGQWLLQKRNANGTYTSYGLTGENGKAIGFTAGLPTMLTLGSGGSTAWADITDKPSEFTPAAHNQAWSTITSTPTTLTGYGITDALAAATAASTYAPLASPTITGTAVLPSTTSIGTVSATELGYLDGTTSAIQTQLDSKLSSAVEYIATTATLKSNRRYIVAPTSTYTLTLPASPAVNDVIELIWSGATWSAAPLSLGRNGQLIDSTAANYDMYPGTDYNGNMRLIFSGGGVGWSVTYITVRSSTLTGLSASRLFGTGAAGTTPVSYSLTSPLTLNTTGATLSIATGGISNSLLTNSSITINGSAISLGGSVSNLALTTGTLAQFASTTSAELRGVLSDESGTGNILTTNGSGAGLTALNGSEITSGTVPAAQLGSGTAITTKYLRGDNTWQTLSGGGDALTSGTLAQFAATTSAQLRGVLTDESGTGVILTANGSAASLTSFPTLNQDTTGTAAIATTATVSDAAGDTTTWPLLGTSATGNLGPATDAGITYNATTNALTASTFVGALTGNASTATTLATARNINGVAFDGSANITIATAPAISVATLSGDYTVTESTALATPTGMSLAVTANKTYIIRVWGNHRSAGSGNGLRYAIKIPSGTLSVAVQDHYSASQAQGFLLTASDTEVVQATAVGSDVPIILDGVITIGVTGGNVELRLASELSTTGCTATFKDGMRMRIMEVTP